MASQSHSYLIVGAGVFGVSTAYHLIQRYPNATVTIIDRDAYDAESRVAASWDWNKVVRADYDDFYYCRLANESYDIFKSDPLWKPHFHETGIYWLCRGDYARKVLENYRLLGRKAGLKALSVAEARKMHAGLFEEADFTNVTEVLINPTSGWGAAGDCLRAVTKKALELGVRYVVGEVASLKFDQDGSCIGVETTRGDVLTATKTILSTGAYTAKLLEYSAARTGKEDLRAGTRIVAAGITTGMTRLDEKMYEQYAKMPVGMQGYPTEIGPFLGSLPPTPDRELKWWGQKIFTNFQQVLPGRFVSAPPAEPDYAQWKISNKLKDDIKFVRSVFYGDRCKDWKSEKHRICWDAFTTSSDFIISPHAAARNLYVATCGNFHGWKFFPVLGKYIIQMLEGTLEPALVQKWAWDRERPDSLLNPEYPRFEMNDLMDSKPML